MTAKNLGSAKTGTGHYMMQKATSIALILLALVLACSATELARAGFSYDAVRAFFVVPTNAVLVILTIIAACLHFAGHVREVIEDYIHHEGVKIALLLIVKLGAIALVVSMSYSVILMSILGGVQ